jgi:arylsulfatase A
MVEAAGLPPKEIKDGDGWSFWQQCLGKPGKQREWIYCHYFPRPSAKKYDNKYSHYKVRFARDKRYKLYNDGKLYDTIKDVWEKTPITDNSANKMTQSVRQKLQAALDSYPKAGLNANRRNRPSTKN